MVCRWYIHIQWNLVNAKYFQGCGTVFSAGLDLNELYQPDVQRFKSYWTTFQDVWLKLYGSSFPTAAAINVTIPSISIKLQEMVNLKVKNRLKGHAPAGGCFLAISCEYRVMCPGYKIGLNETRLGLVVPAFLRASMRNTLSNREAEKALTLGTLYTTEEAHKVSLRLQKQFSNLQPNRFRLDSLMKLPSINRKLLRGVRIFWQNLKMSHPWPAHLRREVCGRKNWRNWKMVVKRIFKVFGPT